MTTLELTISRFVEHKRAVGRKYESEEAELRLLMRFAQEHGAVSLPAAKHFSVVGWWIGSGVTLVTASKPPASSAASRLP